MVNVSCLIEYKTHVIGEKNLDSYIYENTLIKKILLQ